MAHPNSVFDYSDYKAFIRDLDETRPRGFRKSLAAAIPCQTAYVSQVLNGHAHFNWEQAEAAARFLELSKPELRYFLLLVESARAGTQSLKRVIEEQLEELRERHLLLKERIGVQATLSAENQTRYYSAWYYAAVHMAVTIPSLRSRATIAKSLHLSPEVLAPVLDFLASVGLIVKQGERYYPGTTLIHLEKNSPAIFQHHANWRLKALSMMSADVAQRNVHYSTVVTLSAEDAKKIRVLFTQAISDASVIIKPSPEEQMFGINLDLYRLDEGS
ncbi:TIGR02147 family protein [Bdellovibrionota bacterium FG-1]